MSTCNRHVFVHGACVLCKVRFVEFLPGQWPKGTWFQMRLIQVKLDQVKESAHDYMTYRESRIIPVVIQRQSIEGALSTERITVCQRCYRGEPVASIDSDVMHMVVCKECVKEARALFSTREMSITPFNVRGHLN